MTDKHPALTDREAADAWIKGHHVFTGRYGVHRGPDKEIGWGNNKGKPRCCAAVHDRSAGVGFNQCDRLGKEQTADEHKYWWCGTHGPTGATKREERVEAEYRAKRQAEAERRFAAVKRNPHIIALLKIAKGDNNPMDTAKEALGEYWELLKDADIPYKG